MLIARFGPTTAWVGKTIIYEDGRFVLEGYGPVLPDAILEYERQGHLVWAHEGSRAWVQVLARRAEPVEASRAARSRRLAIVVCLGVVLLAAVIAAIAIPAYRHHRETARVAAVREGIRTIRRGLDDFFADHNNAYPVPTVVTQAGLTDHVRDWPTNPYTGRPMAQGSEEGDFRYWVDQSGLSCELTGYVAEGPAIKLVHRVPDEQAKREVIAEGLHSIQVGIESYGIDHGGALPTAAEVSQAGLAAYVDDWPLNPYTGMPVAQGTALGDFVYSVSPDGRSFQLTAFGPNGATLTLPLQ